MKMFCKAGIEPANKSRLQAARNTIFSGVFHPNQFWSLAHRADFLELKKPWFL